MAKRRFYVQPFTHTRCCAWLNSVSWLLYINKIDTETSLGKAHPLSVESAWIYIARFGFLSSRTSVNSSLRYVVPPRPPNDASYSVPVRTFQLLQSRLLQPNLTVNALAACYMQLFTFCIRRTCISQESWYKLSSFSLSLRIKKWCPFEAHTMATTAIAPMRSLLRVAGDVMHN